MYSRLLAITLLSIPLMSHAQTGTDAPLLVRKTADFEVDGKGSAANWQRTEFVTLAKWRGDGAYASRFKVLYSEKGVYCLFESEDRRIVSTLREDFADIYNEDVVEVFFWPDESSNIYFEYELSPHNFELPILVPNYNGEFFGWRPWHYEGAKRTRRATHIHERDGKVTGWTAEFFIPFALLNPLRNVPAVSGTRWRANFYRIDYDEGMTGWHWKPVRKNFHDYERFGTIVFE